MLVNGYDTHSVTRQFVGCMTRWALLYPLPHRAPALGSWAPQAKSPRGQGTAGGEFTPTFSLPPTHLTADLGHAGGVKGAEVWGD